MPNTVNSSFSSSQILCFNEQISEQATKGTLSRQDVTCLREVRTCAHIDNVSQYSLQMPDCKA